jgi:hypothetical protein
MSLFPIGPTLSIHLVTKRTIDEMAGLAAYAASLNPEAAVPEPPSRAGVPAPRSVAC